MAQALELVIGGLSLGGIYALLAFALSLTISTTRILNVAHGVFFVWRGAVFILLSQHLRLGPALSILILTALFFGFALVFQWGIVRPLLGRSVRDDDVAAAGRAPGGLLVGLEEGHTCVRV